MNNQGQKAYKKHPGTSLINKAIIILIIESGIERDSLAEGYTIVVDPGDAIAESNEDNNRFDVPPGVWLQVMWTHIEAPYNSRNTVEFEFDVQILSGSGGRSSADTSTTSAPKLRISSIRSRLIQSGM